MDYYIYLTEEPRSDNVSAGSHQCEWRHHGGALAQLTSESSLLGSLACPAAVQMELCQVFLILVWFLQYVMLHKTARTGQGTAAGLCTSFCVSQHCASCGFALLVLPSQHGSPPMVTVCAGALRKRGLPEELEVTEKSGPACKTGLVEAWRGAIAVHMKT